MARAFRMVSMTIVDVRSFTDLGSISVVSRERVLSLRWLQKKLKSFPLPRKQWGLRNFSNTSPTFLTNFPSSELPWLRPFISFITKESLKAGNRSQARGCGAHKEFRKRRSEYQIRRVERLYNANARIGDKEKLSGDNSGAKSGLYLTPFQSSIV